jgi:hypothetical protein
VTAVVVMGTDADAVAARVAELRASGRRAAGFVGDDRAAAEAMAAELFGEDAEVAALVPG